MSRVASEKAEMACFLCYKGVSSKQALVRHLESEQRRCPEKTVSIAAAIEKLQKRQSVSCAGCSAHFDNEYYLTQHIRLIHPPEKIEPVTGGDVVDTTETEEFVDRGDSPEQRLAQLTVTPVLSQTPAKTVTIAPLAPMKVRPKIYQKIPLEDLVHIQLFERTDYIALLSQRMNGDEQAVYRFLRDCLFLKHEGDINMFEAIHLQGRMPRHYPLRLIDAKKHLYECITPEGEICPKSAASIIELLVRNMQDCYMRLNSRIIDQYLECVGGHDFIFDCHNMQEWHDHVLEYGQERYRHRMLTALTDRMVARYAELKNAGSP